RHDLTDVDPTTLARRDGWADDEPVYARLDGHDTPGCTDRWRGDRPLVAARGNWTRRLERSRGWAGAGPGRRSGTLHFAVPRILREASLISGLTRRFLPPWI